MPLLPRPLDILPVMTGRSSEMLTGLDAKPAVRVRVRMHFAGAARIVLMSFRHASGGAQNEVNRLGGTQRYRSRSAPGYHDGKCGDHHKVLHLHDST